MTTKGKKLTLLLILILCLAGIGGCSSGTDFPPRFTYGGKEFSYSGQTWKTLPERYEYLGNVEEVLQITWNYGELFGGAESTIYRNTENGDSLLISAGNNNYNLFLSAELNGRHYVFVRGMLYYNTNQASKELPRGFVLFGTASSRVYDRLPCEELTFLNGAMGDGHVYVSGGDEEPIYWEDIDYPGTYYRCEPYGP